MTLRFRFWLWISGCLSLICFLILFNIFYRSILNENCLIFNCTYREFYFDNSNNCTWYYLYPGNATVSPCLYCSPEVPINYSLCYNSPGSVHEVCPDKSSCFNARNGAFQYIINIVCIIFGGGLLMGCGYFLLLEYRREEDKIFNYDIREKYETLN